MGVGLTGFCYTAIGTGLTGFCYAAMGAGLTGTGGFGGPLTVV